MRVGVKFLLVAGGDGGRRPDRLLRLAPHQARGLPAYAVPVQQANGQPVVDLEIQTVAAIGPKLSPNPDWVSYLVHNPSGWKRETVWHLPANATVHVTIYNFDGASGLRNPFFGRPQGIVGNRIVVDGKPVEAIDPNDASHTFAVPALGIIVAAPGVADNAKNQCGYAPCPMSNAHRTITVHVPHRRRPATTAGSASSPARPGGSTASAGRCRRSATWTASST